MSENKEKPIGGGGGIASQAQLVKEANFGRAIRENYLNIECFGKTLLEGTWHLKTCLKSYNN